MLMDSRKSLKCLIDEDMFAKRSKGGDLLREEAKIQ